jgi:hypothetical protein
MMAILNLRRVKQCVLLVLFFCGSPACAQMLDGTWLFEKVVDFTGHSYTRPPARVSSINITKNKLTVGPDCSVALTRTDYRPDIPFQALFKSGESEVSIRKFFLQQLNFKLESLEGYYSVESDDVCNKLGSDWLASGNRLIAIRAGGRFYSFTRGGSESTAADDRRPVAAPILTTVDLQGLKTSQLPFRLVDFERQCLTKLPRANGAWTQLWVQSTRCAPAYFPFLATKQSKDKLSQLVGMHNYYKNRGEREHPEDYDNPVSHGLHPLFVILPPMGSVIVVRVEDLEGGKEKRDTMSGAYLAIKDGKVTDQLNDGCDFTPKYECVSEGKMLFQLTEAGKFKKLN